MTKKTQQQSPALDGLYDGLRRPGIMRSSDDKWFAGVCTGISRRLGVDPLVVRGAFILLGIFFGVGVSFYLVLWLLMPNERGEISLERALKYGDGGPIFLLVITAMSVFGGGPWFGDGGFRGVRTGGVVVVAVLAWFFLTRTDTGRELASSSGWGRRPSESTGQQTGASGHEGAGVSGGLSQGNAAAAAGAAAGSTAAGSAPAAPTWGAPAPTPQRQHEQVRTIGLTWTLVVLGAALAVGSLLHTLAQTGDWPGNHLAVAVAGGLAVVGLSLVIGGVAGRRSGVRGPVAGFAIAFLALTTVVPAGIDRPWELGDKSYPVTTLSGSNDYQLGVGQLTVDLTKAGFAATDAKPDVVTAALGVGQLDIRIPKDTSVVVNVNGRLGEAGVWTPAAAVDDKSKDSTLRAEGANWSRTYTFGSGKPELTVDAQVGVGQIRVIGGSVS